MPSIGSLTRSTPKTSAGPARQHIRLDTLTVLRIRTLVTVGKFDIEELVRRAIEATAYPGTNAVDFYRELVARVGDDGLGLFVGFEDAEPKAIAIGVLPTSVMMMAPQVALVYSEGDPRLIRKVAVRMREWFKDAGYSHGCGWNLYRDDKVFMRGFRHWGKPRRIGSLILFEFS